MPPLAPSSASFAQALAQVRGARGRAYWGALDQLVAHPAFAREIARTAPALARIGSSLGRREVMKCMGAALALAGITGCERQPDECALPFVVEPEGTEPGVSRFYATAFDYAGVAQPILGRTIVGRPTKIEGNPDHPASLGAADAFTQASLLGLYDPERSGAPLRLGRETSWDQWDRAATRLRLALDRSGGAGFRLLTGPIGSPLLIEQIAALMARWPEARWHVHDPVGSREGDATREAFGRPLDRRLRLDLARVIVSLDDDLLGPGPFQTLYAGMWGRRRARFQAGGEDALLMAAEPSPTLTGIAARNRLAADEDRIPALLSAIAARLGFLPAAASPLNSRERTWVETAAAALARAPGDGLLTVGAHHPPAVQALGWAINGRLGNFGRTIAFAEPAFAGSGIEPAPFDALERDLSNGRVSTLFMLETSPVYSAPGGRFGALCSRAALRIHAGLHADETAVRAHWHLPLTHALEQWSDGRAADGSAVLVQPLVRPFLDIRSRHALIAQLSGNESDAHGLLKASWRQRWGLIGDAFETRWTEALLSGRAAGRPPPLAGVAAPAVAPLRLPATARDRLRLTVRPDPTIWDGSFAQNPWLQECPKPVTKLTWDNAVQMAPATAERLGLEDGDLVRLSANGRSLIAPVVAVAGQARRTILVHQGYGRAFGRVAEGAGFSAFPLIGPDATATIEPIGRRHHLARSQRHFGMAGHDFVRATPSPGAALPPADPRPNAYRDLPERPGPQWGMAIDLDLCIGCNACVVACVAENNVPMVGREEVAKGREMHWLRVDRYTSGAGEDAVHAFQPVPCMHCEDAPCEMGCPVNAAVHSPDGLNLQVYNRCIGTRTCSAFCPYKVRRFNWFDYTEGDSPELKAARNTDVSVRSRGVMEKCTYCVQRIERARIDAKVAGAPLDSGSVQTACQQTCPTNAIVFGDLSDPDSAVSRLKRSGRHYVLLGEANTRPRTTYLARIRPEGESE